jgi:spermidine synthase
LGLNGLVIAWGIQAIVMQSLLLREALVLMFGSEFAWGVVLFAWLLGVGIGGVFGGRLESKLGRSELGLIGVLAALSAASCGELWIFRGARGWMSVGPGEFLPLAATALVAVVFLAPVGALIGMAFPLACRVAEQRNKGGRNGANRGVGPLGNVYALESLGSLIGGAAFSFWAVEHLRPVEIAMSCAVITTLASAALLRGTTGRMRGPVSLLALAVSTLLATIFAGERLHQSLVDRRWRDLAAGYEMVVEADSKYQNLAVGRLAGQYTLYTNGQVSVDFPDPYTYAPLAHFWMCQHPAPRRVLLLGGGAEGILSEVLRHPVDRIDYVEPDPLQIQLIRPYLSEVDRRALRDDRVRVHYRDARYFVKTQHDRFDLIIARLPEPTSALRARLYTSEFFGELRRAMTRRSVLCMTAAATPGELTDVSGEYLASIVATIRLHFPRVTVSWGDPAQVLAATDALLTSIDPAVLAERYASRGVVSELFHPVWFEGANDWLDREKVGRRAAELEAVRSARISTDLHPAIFLQRLVLWDRMTGGRFGLTIERLRSITWGRFLGGFIVVASGMLLAARMLRRARTGWAQGAVDLSVASTGFVTMAMSIVWLFAFQNLYGYVYQRVGWIIAIFMGGLVIGCTVISHRAWRAEEAKASRFSSYLWKRLVAVDVLLALLALSAPPLLSLLGAIQMSRFSFVVVEWTVSVMVGLTGALGGAAFALAGGVRLHAVGRAGKAAGGVVGADHVGACLGALFTGLLLVPVYGIMTTALLLAGIKVVSAGLLLLTGRVNQCIGGSVSV